MSMFIMCWFRRASMFSVVYGGGLHGVVIGPSLGFLSSVVRKYVVIMFSIPRNNIFCY